MNILTFDIEEWFHLLDNESTKTEKEWSKYESRIHQNMDRIFDLLDKNSQKATFFVMGWIADKYPEIVKEIVSRGFEIGSHTHLHQLAYNQTKSEFRNDVERSIKVLEDISGEKVKYFRAPGFSITGENIWAFETLFELGIEIDCSVFPAGRAHGGLPTYGVAEPSVINYNDITLKELPINTFSILNKPFIFSGGGYFRLLPYSIVSRMTSKSSYVMSYIHPRDLDFSQPVIKELSMLRKFKSYVGLKGAEAKLERWISDYTFIDINQANQIIDWDKVKKINF